MYFRVFGRIFLVLNTKAVVRNSFLHCNHFRSVGTIYQLDNELAALVENISYNSKQWESLIFKLQICVREVEQYSKKQMNLFTFKVKREKQSVKKFHITEDNVSENLNWHKQPNIIKAILISAEESYHSLSESERKTDYKNALILLADSKCPSDNVLLYLADLFSLNGNLKGLSLILRLYEKGDPEHFKNHCSLDHYVAQASWVTGNFKRSLEIFSRVYFADDHLRSTVVGLIKRMIVHVVEKEGKAVNTMVKNFIAEFSERNNDMSLMTTLWYAMLLSDWYRDQEYANEIFLKSVKLQKSVAWMMPHITGSLLRYHRIDTFYRLMELLLKCSMEKSFGIMLRGLFDYYYSMGDFKRCSAVVKCSNDLNVSLTKDQEYKFHIFSNSNIKGPPGSNHIFENKGGCFKLRF